MLSVDHRAVDGVEASKFLHSLRDVISDPDASKLSRSGRWELADTVPALCSAISHGKVLQKKPSSQVFTSPPWPTACPFRVQQTKKTTR
ncbi:2-oxo acid dehydrogenase subunit E2 [Mesorhizobium sp. M1307]|uniref:2-oxo acid dehydrogenase subunit E2 n=1 Tax=Mesorhizobium sp. M1307 TaxID=2957079 RepID=UPI003337025D